MYSGHLRDTALVGIVIAYKSRRLPLDHFEFVDARTQGLGFMWHSAAGEQKEEVYLMIGGHICLICRCFGI